MKYLLVGDSHWGISGCNQSMIQQNINVWNYIFSIAESHNVEAIIDCGDFLDKRKEIDANLLDIINKNVMEKLPCPLYLTVGNHNLYYRDNSLVNNISIFKKMFPNDVEVVDKPMSLETIDLIPWVNKDNVDEISKYINDSMNDYCVGHFELNGFNFDKVRVATVNDEKISKSKLGKYKKVFSGHYHIRSEKDNILYVGTPHQLTWIDEGVEKYIYILDTDSGDITELVVPFEMFKQIEIKEDNWDYYCTDELKGKKVRILYDDTFDSKLFNDIQTRFIQINPDIQFIRKATPKKKDVEIKLDESKNLLDSILDYVNNIKPENQDKIESLIKKVYN